MARIQDATGTDAQVAQQWRERALTAEAALQHIDKVNMEHTGGTGLSELADLMSAIAHQVLDSLP